MVLHSNNITFGYFRSMIPTKRSKLIPYRVVTNNTKRAREISSLGREQWISLSKNNVFYQPEGDQ
jgi:hypothetical protein